MTKVQGFTTPEKYAIIADVAVSRPIESMALVLFVFEPGRRETELEAPQNVQMAHRAMPSQW
jgi:hypothetical protein